jgi:hypothetical protein
MAVEAGVDLAAVEELRQKLQRVHLPPFQVGRINNSFPIFV